jgi:hypothetical protein
LNFAQSRTVVYSRYQLGKLMLYQLSYSRAAAETRARAGGLPIFSSHSIR